jgi:hypothetical protein
MLKLRTERNRGLHVIQVIVFPIATELRIREEASAYFTNIHFRGNVYRVSRVILYGETICWNNFNRRLAGFQTRTKHKYFERKNYCTRYVEQKSFFSHLYYMGKPHEVSMHVTNINFASVTTACAVPILSFSDLPFSFVTLHLLIKIYYIKCKINTTYY